MNLKQEMHLRNQKRMHEALFVTWVGLWINVAVCGGKIVAGALGNSRAVVADGVHSLSDLITDIAVLVGVRYWVAPADERHPYGHQRLESLVALSIGVLLGVAGIGIALEAAGRIGEKHTEPVGSYLALGVVFVSIILKEWLFRWTKRKGQEIKSSAVEANAWDHRSDAISSIPIFFTVAVSLWIPSLDFLDLIGAGIVAVFIIHAAWKICKPELKTLLDEGADDSQLEKLIEYVLQIEDVKGAHAVRTRFMGQAMAIDMHVQVDASLTVREGNIIAHRVEEYLYSEEATQALGFEICDALVHIDPWDE